MVPISTASSLKVLANHGWFAAGELMGIPTVVPFFANPVHEIPTIDEGCRVPLVVNIFVAC